MQISRVPTVPGKHVLIELEHFVQSFQSLEGEGKKATLRFTAVEGGQRAIRLKDIVDVI